MNKSLFGLKGSQKNWIRMLGLGLLLVLGASGGLAKDVQGQLKPWTPYNWPKDKAGEVRVLVGNSAVATTPIATDGKFKLTLPDKPTIAANGWMSFEDALSFPVDCDFTPTKDAVEPKVVRAEFQVYAAGDTQPFGNLYIRIFKSGTSGTKDTTGITLLVYADRDSKLQGSGKCSGQRSNTSPEKGGIELDVQLKAGWNFVVMRSEVGKQGIARIKVETNPDGEFQLFPNR